MLVDADALEKPEADLVVAHHDRVGPGVAPDEVRPLDRGAGRGAADHAPALQDAPERVVHLRVEVGVGEPPLPSAGEPHAAGLVQGCRELVGVGHVAVVCVQDRDVGGPRSLEGAPSAEELVVALASTGRGDHDDGRRRSAGQLDEAREDGGIRERAPGHDQAAVGGTDLLRGRRRREEGGGDRRDKGDLNGGGRAAGSVTVHGSDPLEAVNAVRGREGEVGGAGNVGSMATVPFRSPARCRRAARGRT